MRASCGVSCQHHSIEASIASHEGMGFGCLRAVRGDLRPIRVTDGSVCVVGVASVCVRVVKIVYAYTPRGIQSTLCIRVGCWCGGVGGSEPHTALVGTGEGCLVFCMVFVGLSGWLTYVCVCVCGVVGLDQLTAPAMPAFVAATRLLASASSDCRLHVRMPSATH
jgi:hypothetical protein